MVRKFLALFPTAAGSCILEKQRRVKWLCWALFKIISLATRVKEWLHNTFLHPKHCCCLWSCSNRDGWVPGTSKNAYLHCFIMRFLLHNNFAGYSTACPKCDPSGPCGKLEGSPFHPAKKNHCIWPHFLHPIIMDADNLGHCGSYLLSPRPEMGSDPLQSSPICMIRRGAVL